MFRSHQPPPLRILAVCSVAFLSIISLPLLLGASQEQQKEPAPSRVRLAVRVLAHRAQEGDAKSLYDLASLHDKGYDSIPVDTARSTALYRLSAEKGYAPARNYLGFRLYKGEGVPRDIGEGLHWLGLAAIQGDPKAANNLGWILKEGDGVVRDPEKTAFWFRRAAEGNLPTGQAQYADLLRIGYGVEPDTVMADSLYRRAIDGGLRDAEAKLLAMQHERWKSLSPQKALDLGLYHYSHRAPVIAVSLFDQVVRHTAGQTPDSLVATRARALAMLGDAYTRAVGVSYDHDKSVDCFAEAAMLGNPSAQFIIGELLEIFPDALQDFNATLPPDKALPSDAKWWLDKAAQSAIYNAEQANRLLLAVPGERNGLCSPVQSNHPSRKSISDPQLHR